MRKPLEYSPWVKDFWDIPALMIMPDEGGRYKIISESEKFFPICQICILKSFFRLKNNIFFRSYYPLFLALAPLSPLFIPGESPPQINNLMG